LKAINGAVNVLIVKTDVTFEADVANLFEKVQSVFGRPADVVLSNAGALSEALLIGKTKSADWWKSFVRHLSVLISVAINSSGRPPVSV
jgi:NAD(P)-dependent dehydrogenase (short-subunit alcohol dehydrogenase family)